jgi:hypothetical protein
LIPYKALLRLRPIRFALIASLSAGCASQSPVKSVEMLGQTAYFPVDVALLKRMAASRKLALNVRAGDLTMVDFIPTQGTRAALKQFVIDRGIANY